MNRLINKVSEFFGTYRHSWILVYFFLYMVWFSWLENNIVPRYWMYSPIDDWIPFVPIFIIPYLFWFIYVAAAIVFFLFHSRQDFYQLCAYLFIGMSICLTLYMLFPNGHQLRPAITGDSLWERLVVRLYSADTPTNVAPSIHVYNSIGVHIAILRSSTLKRHRWIQWTSLVLMVLIVLSTVMLKQHSIDDILFALPLSLAMYFLVYRINVAALLRRKTTQRSNSGDSLG